jgi:hypothetical protein
LCGYYDYGCYVLLLPSAECERERERAIERDIVHSATPPATPRDRRRGVHIFLRPEGKKRWMGEGRGEQSRDVREQG